MIFGSDGFYPDSELVSRYRLGVHLESRYVCGCICKEFAGGLLIRFGCAEHGDFSFYKCGTNSCGRKFLKKKDRDAHKESHRI